MGSENLWGNLPDVGTLRTPLTILKEQASVLGEMTEGLLIGNVKLKRSSVDDKFVLNLDIIAPALDNYTYSVVTVKQPPEFYPLELNFSQESKGDIINDEKTFVDGLGKILSSDEVKKVVVGLLSQIQSVS